MSPEQAITAPFLEHGLLGAMLVVAAWVIWKQYHENSKLRDEMLSREIARVSQYHELVRDLEDTLQASLEALDRGGGRIRTTRRYRDEES